MKAAALERLRYEIARCPFHQLLRPVAVSADVERGTVAVRLPFSQALGLSPDSDVFHGGVLAALVDITAHAAVAVRAGYVSPTVDLRVDYLRAAHGPMVEAEARLVRFGRTLATVDVTVMDEHQVVVAIGRGSFVIGHGPTPEYSQNKVEE